MCGTEIARGGGKGAGYKRLRNYYNSRSRSDNRSEIPSAEPGNDLNRRILPAPDEGEPTSKLPSTSTPGEEEFLKSPNSFSFDDHGVYIDGNGEPLSSAFTTFTPEELLHRSYLTQLMRKSSDSVHAS